MSVRVAGPAAFAWVEELEGRRLLAAVGDAIGWDLQTPIQGELSQKGEVDYYRFDAAAGQQIVFDTSGMKRFAILDSDGTAELDQVMILDGVVPDAPGRLVWEAPHAGTFYISVSRYTAFLIDSPTGPYSLAAYAVVQDDGPVIVAGQTVSGDLSGAGEIDVYNFDAKAGTIYRFELKAPADAAGAGHVMGVVEAQPWRPMPLQPQDAEESYPGHNLRFTNIDEQKGLRSFAEWIAPASGRYHFSVATLDAEHIGPYTLSMSQRAFPCDPQSGGASPTLQEAAVSERNTPPKSSSHSARHQKPRKHHRRPVSAAHKHERPAAKENLHSARRKLLSLARD